MKAICIKKQVTLVLISVDETLMQLLKIKSLKLNVLKLKDFQKLRTLACTVVLLQPQIRRHVILF